MKFTIAIYKFRVYNYYIYIYLNQFYKEDNSDDRYDF